MVIRTELGWVGLGGSFVPTQCVLDFYPTFEVSVAKRRASFIDVFSRVENFYVANRIYGLGGSNDVMSRSLEHLM